MALLAKIQVATILIPLILAEIRDWWDPCPNSTGKELCNCNLDASSGVKLVDCENVKGDDLPSATESFSYLAICSFSIGNSQLDDVSHETVWHLRAEILSIYNSVIGNFSLFTGLSGMEDILRGVIINNVSVQNWILSSGEQFLIFRIFHLTSCPDKEWNAASVIPYLPSYLCDIVIRECTVNSTDDFSFERFENLEKLDLSNTQLESINRNLLPQPAHLLSNLDLSFNPITSIPKDMFTDMPELTDVSLKGTSLTNLDYQTFKPLFQQRITLHAGGVSLTCDCESTWLYSRKNAWDISNVVCDRPRSMKNRLISSVLPMDVCMNCEEYEKY